MKWSTLATLFAAPMALAGALQADVVARTNKRYEHVDTSYGDGYGSGSSGSTTVVVVEEVVLIWVCMGGGSKTTTVNSVDSVTNTMSSIATHTVSSRSCPCVNAKIA
jgi:hypothetical protein